MNTNARTFRTKTADSQTAYVGMRMRAGVTAGARLATAIANVTMVSTAERPSRSARIQTPKVPTNWTMIAVGTSQIERVTHNIAHDSASPTTTLPTSTSPSVGSSAPA